jgi:hypothetical protein
LAGRIQELYGVAKAEAEKQANEWSRKLKHSGHEAAARPSTSKHASG